MIGVVLGMLFGLGVIGGLHGPDLGINAPNFGGSGSFETEGGKVMIDGAEYDGSSITT